MVNPRASAAFSCLVLHAFVLAQDQPNVQPRSLPVPSEQAQGSKSSRTHLHNVAPASVCMPCLPTKAYTQNGRKVGASPPALWRTTRGFNYGVKYTDLLMTCHKEPIPTTTDTTEWQQVNWPSSLQNQCAVPMGGSLHTMSLQNVLPSDTSG